jgi:hypothetical protein
MQRTISLPVIGAIIAAFAAAAVHAQPLAPRELLEQAAAAMGGWARLQKLDNPS